MLLTLQQESAEQEIRNFSLCETVHEITALSSWLQVNITSPLSELHTYTTINTTEIFLSSNFKLRDEHNIQTLIHVLHKHLFRCTRAHIGFAQNLN